MNTATYSLDDDRLAVEALEAIANGHHAAACVLIDTIGVDATKSWGLTFLRLSALSDEIEGLFPGLENRASGRVIVLRLASWLRRAAKEAA